MVSWTGLPGVSTRGDGWTFPSRAGGDRIGTAGEVACAFSLVMCFWITSRSVLDPDNNRPTDQSTAMGSISPVSTP
jgi:hypothetical protein